MDIHSIFMPEGLCARCGAITPVIWESFKDVTLSTDEATELGFCTKQCRNAFCAGVKAVNLAL